MIKTGTIIAAIALILAFYLRKDETELQTRLQKVLSGLLATEQTEKFIQPKIAVGFGSCQDLVFDARKLFSLYVPENVQLSGFQPDDVRTILQYEDLIRSYLYYFQHGAAAERFTPNATLFDDLVKLVKSISPNVIIGGNAATIARRFVIEGYNDVLLGSSMTKESKEMLPNILKIVGKVTNGDDIHLVFEYKQNEIWQNIIAPRANRYILHHDTHNPSISSLEDFGINLKQFRPDLFVISGLQMMDKYPMVKSTRYTILKNIQKQILSLPETTKVHFEMASLTDMELILEILELIVPFSNSLGMNEQELANLHSLIETQKITTATDSNPKVSQSLDMMRRIYDTFEKANTKSNRQLTRLHVHTLAYQLIFVKNNTSWKNTAGAAARASLVANTFVCNTQQVDLRKSMLVLDESFSSSSLPDSERIFINDTNPVTCWTERDYEVCIAPNLVCTNAKQTAGCGDNISAAGLAAQL